MEMAMVRRSYRLCMNDWSVFALECISLYPYKMDEVAWV